MAQQQNLTRLGAELRRLREAAGLSLRDLSTKTGFVPSTLLRLENGAIDSPRPDHLQRLARALGADIEDFYALAGYFMPEGLPEFAPYLRSKYGLPDQAVTQLDEYFRALRDQWQASREEEHHDRGDQSP